MRMNDLDLHLLGLQRPWQRLRFPAQSLPEIPEPNSPAEQALRRMIPAFLAQQLREHSLLLPRADGGFLAQVHKAFASWLHDQPGAERLAVPRCSTLVDPADPAERVEQCFAAMLRELLRARAIRALPRPRGKPVPPCSEVVLLRNGRCFVHWQALAKVVAKRSAVRVDWEALSEVLVRANVICKRQFRSIRVTRCAAAYRRIWTLRAGWWRDHVAGPLAARCER
jgi:hypothetical protein